MTRTWLVASVAVAMLAAEAALAQQDNRLDCQGQWFGYPATIAGMRRFIPTNRLGDGVVGFRGELRAAQMVGEIAYEGSTSGAFPGYVSGPLGTVQVAVLDNTGGRMILYEGAPSLGAPRELGVFVCTWR